MSGNSVKSNNIRHYFVDLYFYSNNIFNSLLSEDNELNALTSRIMVECAKIDGNKMLLHQVHENLVKCINICIANDGKHIDVTRIKIKKVFYVFTYLLTSVQSLWTPAYVS